MKTPVPWWLHLLVGVVLLSTGVLAWHSWMISTRDNPTVIIHRHISECAWLDDEEKQCMWQYMFSLEAKTSACCDIAERSAEATKALKEDMETSFVNMDARNQKDFSDLRADFKALQKQIRQHRHGCGEW